MEKNYQPIKRTNLIKYIVLMLERMDYEDLYQIYLEAQRRS